LIQNSTLVGCFYNAINEIEDAKFRQNKNRPERVRNKMHRAALAFNNRRPLDLVYPIMFIDEAFGSF